MDRLREVAGEMPSWWKLGMEIRGRAESFQGYPGLPGGGDSYYLHRVRLDSTFTILPWVHVFTELQDSRAPGYERRPVPGSVVNTLDLRMAYVELGNTGEQPWSLRVGRQPLIFGDMRVVSTSNWSNAGPAFDAVRITRKMPRAKLDLFASLVVVPCVGVDRPRYDKKLHGFHATITPFKSDRYKPMASVDLYSFWKSNLKTVDELGHPGKENIFTYGLRGVGKAGNGFDYNVEMLLQRGTIAQTPLAAWGGHWELGRQLGVSRKMPRLWLEYNFSSGDRNASDGRRQTLEQLYPSPYSVVGRAGDFASRNLLEPLAGAEWQATSRWKFRATYRAFWVANVHDSLYSLSGGVFASQPHATSRRVGEEGGLWAIFQTTKRLQFWLGYANLTAGPYLKQAGRPDSIRYPYAMWTYTIL